MQKDSEKMYQVYHTILSMALTWALTLAISQYYELRVNAFLCAFFSFLPAILIYLFDCNRKNTVSYLILLSILPVTGFFFWLRRINPAEWVNDLGSWISTYNGSEELYVRSHATFIIFSIGILSSLLFYLLMKKQIAKAVLSVVFFILLLILSIQEVDLHKFVIGTCFFYILSTLVELCGWINSKMLGRPVKKAGILYLAPICLLLAILSVSLPSKPEPIQWKGIRYIYNGLKEKLDYWITEWGRGDAKGEFTVARTGFSDESGELGTASLKQDKSTALMISGFSDHKPMYLIGSVSDIYTGDSWKKSREGFIPKKEEFTLDYLEMVYGLSSLDMETLEKEQLVERRMMTNTYRQIKTKTLFYPLKTSWMNDIRGLNTESPCITFPKPVGDGTNYSYVFFDMNLKGEAFQRMLINLQNFSYDKAPELNVEKIRWMDENLLLFDNANSFLDREDNVETLRERADLIKDHYLKLPNTLPDRVKELALRITRDYDSDYEKLKAIETFLNSYTYSLNPGKMPKKADFVDYFLFESKKGYCISYATAMAVLGRCIGIPTRYVEGFAVTFGEEGNKNMYPVLNSQAHAWAEAYFEGFGWVPFEATPIFFETRYITWKEKVKEEESLGSEESVFEEPPRDYNEQIEDLELPEPVEEEKASNFFLGTVILSITVLVFLIFLVTYYYILKYKYKKILQRADYSGKMYLMFLRILRLLKKEGFTLDAQETILMLAQRVKDHYHYDRVEFTDVANIFMRYRYAGAETTKQEYDQVACFAQGLQNKQREERPRLKLLLEEFIFLMKKSNYTIPNRLD